MSRSVEILTVGTFTATAFLVVNATTTTTTMNGANYVQGPGWGQLARGALYSWLSPSLASSSGIVATAFGSAALSVVLVGLSVVGIMMLCAFSKSIYLHAKGSKMKTISSDVA
jgi:ABC-type multidrug transport system permease subunit